LGARFSAAVQTGPEAHPAPHTTGNEPSPRVKSLGHRFDHPQGRDLKKVELCISNPTLGHCGLFQGVLYLNLYLCALLVFLYTVLSSVGYSEIYVYVYHDYHSCIFVATFFMFFVSLLVVAFSTCRCFCSVMH